MRMVGRLGVCGVDVMAEVWRVVLGGCVALCWVVVSVLGFCLADGCAVGCGV